MKISVVVPTKNNCEQLIECLKSLKEQAVKIHEIIIVAPKNDKSMQSAREFGCKWIEDKLNTIGNAYNIGAENSSGDVVVFIDDDCFAPEDWLGSLLNEFKNQDLDVVGGDDIINTEKSTKFQNALYLLDLYRTPQASLYGMDACKRLRACNIAFKKNIFEKHQFNKNLTGLQEPEFLYRLYKNGYNVKFNPSIKVIHSRRKNSRSLFSQIYRNGIAKADLIRFHRRTIYLYDLIAVSTISITVIFALMYFINPFFISAWLTLIAIYLILKPAYVVLRTKKIAYYHILIKIIFVRELAYGLGLIRGILNKKKVFS